MNVNIIEVALSIIKSIVLGMIFVILGVFLVPNKITVKLLKLVKPDIINHKKSLFDKILHIVLYGFSYEKSDDISVENTRVNELEVHSSKLEILQSNLFAIDSLDGIFDTLKYLGIRHGWNYYTLLEETMEYVRCYADILSNTPQIDQRVINILEKCHDIECKFSDFRSEIDLRKLEGEVYSKRIKEIARYQADLLVEASKEIKALKQSLESEIKDAKAKIKLVSSKIIEDY